MPKGLVFSQFALPGNLLNDGIYLVRVLVVRDEMTILIDADQTIMFEVQDVPRNVAWHGKWSGSVRPRLEWKTSTIPAAVATK